MSNRQDDALPVRACIAKLPSGAEWLCWPKVAAEAYRDIPHEELVRLSDAQSAISSLQARLDAAEADAARVPAGWKLVPIDPTPAMQLAGVTANGSVLFKHGSVEPLPGDGPTTRARMDYLVSYALKAYRAMLAAAPESA